MRLGPAISRSCVILFLTLNLGCHNFYRDRFISTCSVQYPKTKNVEIRELSPDALEAVKKEGYIELGRSQFLSYYFQPSNAVPFAKSIGAELILARVAYERTESGTMPVPVYHSGQTVPTYSYYSGNVSAYGSRGCGYGSYSGSAVSYTQTPGYTTVYNMPYRQDFYLHTAVFMRKVLDAVADTPGAATQEAVSVSPIMPSPPVTQRTALARTENMVAYPANAPRSYSALSRNPSYLAVPGGTLQVKETVDNGRFVLLDDGSLWEVSPLETIDSTLWLRLENIIVVESSDEPGYPYRLVNTDAKSVVSAKLVGQR